MTEDYRSRCTIVTTIVCGDCGCRPCQCVTFWPWAVQHAEARLARARRMLEKTKDKR